MCGLHLALQVSRVLARADLVEGAPLRFHPDVGVSGQHRARPGLAVYRAGLRLTPERHFRLVWVDANKLPDRFEILAGAPGEGGDVVVDYFIGVEPEILP